MITTRLVDSFTHAALSPDPDLAVAALMIARVEYPALDARPYLERLDAFGVEARRRVDDATVASAPDGVDPDRYARVLALNAYVFGELRFVGNEANYEDPRNSFLNEVIDRRTGIPITLALLYMEIARRAGLHVEGINFPGHFLLRCPARRGLPYPEDLIIDAFGGGKMLSRAERRELVQPAPDAESFGVDDTDGFFESRLFVHATKPQILARMLRNLKNVYVRMCSFPQARDVTELLLAVNPSAIDELRDRGLLAYHLKDFSGALRDLQAYLKLSAGAGRLDAEERDEHEKIWEHVKVLRRRVASLN